MEKMIVSVDVDITTYNDGETCESGTDLHSYCDYMNPMENICELFQVELFESEKEYPFENGDTSRLNVRCEECMQKARKA